MSTKIIGLVIIAVALISLFMPHGVLVPVPIPDKTDLLSIAYAADRASKIDLLNKIAHSDASDQDLKEMWNNGVDAARERDFSAFLDKLAEALANKTCAEFALELK